MPPHTFLRAFSFACCCARRGHLYLSHSLSTLPILSLLLLTLVVFDSTEAEDMEVDGGVAVAAADSITVAVLVAGP